MEWLEPLHIFQLLNKSDSSAVILARVRKKVFYLSEFIRIYPT